MKKTYEKPMVIIEAFQLNAAIAASCSSQDYVPINFTEDTCGYGVGNDMQFMFFNNDNCEVDLVGEGGDNNDTTCYHGPYWSTDTFISS